jgi:DNA-3-methyladenine glycosylase II
VRKFRQNQPVQSESEFRTAVVTLTAADPVLSAVVGRHGDPPFWHRPPGFATMILFILEQQVSLASAKAAFDRLEGRVRHVEPEAIRTSTDAELRADGFSRQKAGYARALASAVLSGDLRFEALTALEDDDVRRALVALPGIGPWTADVYLLSCLRRPDVWPAGDRALQVAAAEVLGLAEIPAPGGLREIGERWRPHRSTAARLLWHAYLARRGRS